MILSQGPAGWNTNSWVTVYRLLEQPEFKECESITKIQRSNHTHFVGESETYAHYVSATTVYTMTQQRDVVYSMFVTAHTQMYSLSSRNMLSNSTFSNPSPPPRKCFQQQLWELFKCSKCHLHSSARHRPLHQPLICCAFETGPSVGLSSCSSWQLHLQWGLLASQYWLTFSYYAA